MADRVKHGPTAGFIVIGYMGPMKLTNGYRGSRGPILTHGSIGTLFARREDARRVTAATAAYAARQGYTNRAWTEYRIVRIAPAKVVR